MTGEGKIEYICRSLAGEKEALQIDPSERKETKKKVHKKKYNKNI